MKKGFSAAITALTLVFVCCLTAFAAEKVRYLPNAAGEELEGLLSIAHRGYSAAAPENTLAAFRLAAEYGFDGAECDVSVTCDGAFVIMHDAKVDRTTDGSGYVNSMTLAEIRALTVDAGSGTEQYPGERVPLFSEYLALCSETGIMPVIEIKDCGIDDVPALCEEIAAYYPGGEGTAVIGFGREKVALAEKLLPGAVSLLLVQRITGGAIDYCLENGIDGLDYDYSRNTPAAVKSVSDSGLVSVAWTVDDTQSAGVVYLNGATAVTTNCLVPSAGGGSPGLFETLNDFFTMVWAYFKGACSNFASLFPQC